MENLSEAPSRAPATASAQANSVGSFTSLASNSFVPLRFTAEGNAPFTGKLSTADADDVVFTEVVAKPHLVERTPELIADGGSGYYKVSLLLAGSSILVQDGREVVMQPGDLSVYDTSRPYSLLFDEDIRNLIMMFPKHRLERCREDLLDPVLSDRPVAAIAMRWGFTDAAHFSRVFKAAYGVTPSELRLG